MNNVKKGRPSKPRATSKRAKPAAKRLRKRATGKARVSAEAAAAAVDESAAAAACETRLGSSRPSEPPETPIAAETEIDGTDSNAEREPSARRSEAPEISITGETELDEDAEEFSERDARAAGERKRPTDVSSVSALVLEPRTPKVERNPDVAAGAPPRPAALPTIDRRMGWVVSAVALVLVGWGLWPVRQSAPQPIAAADDGVTRKASAPATAPEQALDANVPHVALETLPIETPPEESTAHGTDDVAPPTEHDSRLAAYKVVTLAAGRAGSCRHRGDGPGPARVSVSFGSDGQVQDVRVHGTYSGTLTGECIAARFRALPPSKGISARTTTVADVQLH